MRLWDILSQGVAFVVSVALALIGLTEIGEAWGMVEIHLPFFHIILLCMK